MMSYGDSRECQTIEVVIAGYEPMCNCAAAGIGYPAGGTIEVGSEVISTI